ncbi:CYTH and CHAD domain-containing protein [Hyphococcus lacteus]|uniref:CHAD domain-containing protein n=1 Tax=Hyphococcus lacteus TaxID=3143536 RepID=A0ABV3Z1V9_9PROT
MGTGRTEFELKFVGAPGDIAKLPNSDFFRAVAPKGSWEKLSSTYYDTSDGSLADAGLSLRLREEGAKLVQAVKARGDNAVTRAEYERELESDRDFPKKTGDAKIDEFIKTHRSAIEPIARIAVDRWSANITFKGTEIELAVDVGRAESWGEAGKRLTCPIAEVELELLDGSPADVFGFARLLIANAKLRMGAGTKLDTAMALRRPAAELLPPQKISVTPDTIAVDALTMLLDTTGTRLASLQRNVVEYRLPEGIHQMRVALRRLRAVERVYRPYLKSKKIKKLAQRAKFYAGILGSARDWDVLLGETIPSTQSSDYAPSGIRALKANAEAERAIAWGVVIEAIDHPDFTEFLLGVTEACVVTSWSNASRKPMRQPIKTFAPEILDHALGRVLGLSQTLDGSEALSARHPMRIALKKLRYPVQLFRSAYPKSERKDYMRGLSMLQDAFGTINDAVVAQSLVDIAAANAGDDAIRAAGFIAGYKAAEAKIAAQQIDKAWAAFSEQRPFWRE